MALKPFSQIEFLVRKEYLENVAIIAGLDSGCSLTKILYVPKSKPTDEAGESYILTCALFHNKNFEAALDWLKKEAVLPEQGSFHVTGAGGVKYKERISEKLGIDVVFINEFLCQCRGVFFLLKYFDDDELFYHKPKIYSDVQEVQTNFREKLPVCDENPKRNFPCLLGILGSGAGLMKVEDNGMGCIFAVAGLGGKTFLGLGKCLLGTNDFDKIIKFAAAGRRSDSQPMTAFERAIEEDIGLDKLSKVEVARSLVSLTVSNILGTARRVAENFKINEFYIGGNLMRAEVFREETELLNQTFGTSKLDIKYLKTGHTGAIGAMISKPGDENKFYEI